MAGQELAHPRLADRPEPRRTRILAGHVRVDFDQHVAAGEEPRLAGGKRLKRPVVDLVLAGVDLDRHRAGIDRAVGCGAVAGDRLTGADAVTRVLGRPDARAGGVRDRVAGPSEVERPVDEPEVAALPAEFPAGAGPAADPMTGRRRGAQRQIELLLEGHRVVGGVLLAHQVDQTPAVEAAGGAAADDAENVLELPAPQSPGVLEQIVEPGAAAGDRLEQIRRRDRGRRRRVLQQELEPRNVRRLGQAVEVREVVAVIARGARGGRLDPGEVHHLDHLLFRTVEVESVGHAHQLRQVAVVSDPPALGLGRPVEGSLDPPQQGPSRGPVFGVVEDPRPAQHPVDLETVAGVDDDRRRHRNRLEQAVGAGLVGYGTSGLAVAAASVTGVVDRDLDLGPQRGQRHRRVFAGARRLLADPRSPLAGESERHLPIVQGDAEESLADGPSPMRLGRRLAEGAQPVRLAPVLAPRAAEDHQHARPHRVTVEGLEELDGGDVAHGSIRGGLRSAGAGGSMSAGRARPRLAAGGSWTTGFCPARGARRGPGSWILETSPRSQPLMADPAAAGRAARRHLMSVSRCRPEEAPETHGRESGLGHDPRQGVRGSGWRRGPPAGGPPSAWCLPLLGPRGSQSDSERRAQGSL